MDPVSKVEKEFIIKAAQDGIRVDGRSLNEMRDIAVDVRHTYTQSSSIVSIGETKQKYELNRKSIECVLLQTAKSRLLILTGLMKGSL